MLQRPSFYALYAANLSRKRRNEPTKACQDAIMQMAALGGAVTATAYVIAGLTMSRKLLRHLYLVDATFLVTVGGISALLGILAKRAFDAYRETPEAADPYRSKNTIRFTNVLYVLIPIAWSWMVGLALRVLGPP